MTLVGILFDNIPKIGIFVKKKKTMGKNTSILLGSHFESFIKRAISTGRYKSISEVIRTALRLLETEEQKIENLRKALELGENSGFLDNFNPEDHLQELHRRNS